MPVANKLLCSVVSLPVANKLAKESVKHPDDKWITDVLTKIIKCQPAVRDILVTGPHTPRVTVGVPGSGRSRKQNKNKQNKKYKNQKSNYLSNVTLVVRIKLTKWFNQSQVSLDIIALRSRSRSRLSGHGQHTPRVTAKSRSRLSSHGQHTPRVTAKSRSRLSSHGQHTPRVTAHVWLSGQIPHTPRVTVDIPDSGFNFKFSPVTAWSQYGHTPVILRSNPGHSPVTALAQQCTSNVTTVLHLSQVRSVQQVTYSHSISRKLRNKLIKQLNGNGKNSFSVCHWNLGAKKWKNKRNQVQALVDHYQADLIFISEANLDESTKPYESLIQGYSITSP